MYRYDSPLFFANAHDFRQRALAAVPGHEGLVRWFVCNAEAGSTALDAREALRADLARRGIVVAPARVKREPAAALDAYGRTAAVGPDGIFPTLPTAVAADREWAARSPG